MGTLGTFDEAVCSVQYCITVIIPLPAASTVSTQNSIFGELSNPVWKRVSSVAAVLQSVAQSPVSSNHLSKVRLSSYIILQLLPPVTPPLLLLSSRSRAVAYF